MKKVLLCKWEIAPGDGEKTKKFKTYEDANTFIRKMLCENIDISDCVNILKKEGDFLYIKAVTDFLKKYFSDPLFPYSESDLPSDKPQDYADSDSYPEDSEFFDEDELSNDYFTVSSGGFRYCFGGYDISSDFMIDKVIPPSYYSEDESVFDYENMTGRVIPNTTNDMVLHLTYVDDWGTSAYPVMILKVLQEAKRPLQQTEIAEEIIYKYDTSIERKAIGRNVKLLIDLGYDIRRKSSGYYLHTGAKEDD